MKMYKVNMNGSANRNITKLGKVFECIHKLEGSLGSHSRNISVKPEIQFEEAKKALKEFMNEDYPIMKKGLEQLYYGEKNEA